MFESLMSFSQRHATSLLVCILVALLAFRIWYSFKRRARISRSGRRSSDADIVASRPAAPAPGGIGSGSGSDSVKPDGCAAPPYNHRGTHGPGGGPDD